MNLNIELILFLLGGIETISPNRFTNHQPSRKNWKNFTNSYHINKQNKKKQWKK